MCSKSLSKFFCLLAVMATVCSSAYARWAFAPSQNSQAKADTTAVAPVGKTTTLEEVTVPKSSSEEPSNSSKPEETSLAELKSSIQVNRFNSIFNSKLLSELDRLEEADSILHRKYEHEISKLHYGVGMTATYNELRGLGIGLGGHIRKGSYFINGGVTAPKNDFADLKFDNVTYNLGFGYEF